MPNRAFYLLFLLFGLGLGQLCAQRTFNVPAYSQRHPEILESPKGIITLSMPNLAAINQEDARRGDGLRFAVPVSTFIDLSKTGQWIAAEDGGRIWLQKINAAQSKGISLAWSQFYLPIGATLHMYGSGDKKQVIGAYTHISNVADGSFFTGAIRGDEAWLEYYEPASVKGQGKLTCQLAYLGYRNAYDPSNPSNANPNSRDTGFNTAWDCMVNAACPESESHLKERRSACRILLVMEEGLLYCSGTVMNNTSNDGKPYVLSAFHCEAGFTPKYNLWRFDFNYESATCANPAVEPAYQSALGCTKKAGAEGTDFLLLELNKSIPVDYNVHFAGWNNAKEFNANSSSFYSHASGDIKKIAIDFDSTIIYNTVVNWNDNVVTPAKTHYLIKSDIGMMQAGSSGCGLLDQNNRIIGQLHGGNNSCAKVNRQLFGILAESWDLQPTSDARLKDWLDPEQSGQITLDGIENPLINQFASIKLRIMTPDTLPVTGLFANYSSPPITVTYEGEGVYRFDQVPAGVPFVITPERQTFPKNGVSAADIVVIQKHILNKAPLTDQYKKMAADVNATSTISSADIIAIQKLILGKSSNLGTVTSWLFSPSQIDIPEVNHDLPTYQLIGVKMGDVNYTRDASK
ncbi:MAG: hypothetical protein ABIV51_02575 [Saprospiraceae bacterium]